MTVAPADSAHPPAAALSVDPPPAADGTVMPADIVGDFISVWLTSRAADGTHDPALVALVGAHRKKDSIVEAALLKGLGLYAQQIAADARLTPVALASLKAPESAA